MPEYEYECQDCHKIFDQKMTIEEHGKKIVKCPKCHSENIQPLMTHIYTRTSTKS